jgi:D-alanine-D-alanine ligase
MITEAKKEDGQQIKDITANTEVFSSEEVACVSELWSEYITLGSEKSGYYFLIAREEGKILGYSCYGPRALTTGTFDLFWIAVDPAIRRSGVGRALLTASEQAIRRLGGRLLVLETSGLPDYAPTRKFYLATGYTQEATIKDFYKIGDDLIIFTKQL